MNHKSHCSFNALFNNPCEVNGYFCSLRSCLLPPSSLLSLCVCKGDMRTMDEDETCLHILTQLTLLWSASSLYFSFSPRKKRKHSVPLDQMKHFSLSHLQSQLRCINSTNNNNNKRSSMSQRGGTNGQDNKNNRL